MKTIPSFSKQFFPIQNDLYAVAYKFTRNRMDADDLVQETSLKVYKNYDKFNPEYDFKAWSLTIMRNTFISNIRKSKVSQSIIQDLKYLSSDDSVSVKLNNDDVKNSVKNDIWTLINALPPKSKEPFVMYSDGYSYDEIASHLEIPIGTVKSRINYARTKLRNTLCAKEIRSKLAS